VVSWINLCQATHELASLFFFLFGRLVAWRIVCVGRLVGIAGTTSSRVGFGPLFADRLARNVRAWTMLSDFLWRLSFFFFFFFLLLLLFFLLVFAVALPVTVGDRLTSEKGLTE
jgi:hypothetical protein